VNIHVFATDYDGTIAEGNRVSETTARALARVRATGRKLLLVTGRMLPDLQAVCPDLERMFDAVVAENGALVYVPERRETRTLGDAPEPALIEALARRGVPIALGGVIVATDAPYAEAALAAIQETGVERALVFNRGALMLLPGGVTKGTGLTAALAALELSPHNMAGIGDAENDHAFLAICECAVAVADAVPALRERADYVTRAPAARGVVEFVEEHLLNDLVELMPRLTRHHLPLGETAGGAPVAVAAHGTRLLIVGPSGSGKSTLTGVLAERVLEAGRSLLLLDPEGDYRTLAELPGVVVFGGKGEQALPTAEEVDQLLRHPHTSLVLDLSAMTLAEKVAYATTVLAVVAAVRSATGLPHWLVIDEAHHVLPADGSPAVDLVRPGAEGLALITLDAARLAAAVHPLTSVVASTELATFHAGVRTVLAARAVDGAPPALDGSALERGEAAVAWLEPPTRAVRFRVSRRRVHHRRHVRKYTEGELPAERSFFFRGPAGALNLRAANLGRFVELAEGVDEATWAHHLTAGDYSAWMRHMIKDPELADEIAAIEASGSAPAESRRQVLERLRARYAV
jgi:hydroxymethylpyrimidine pyrophosphatase-like HAD family hydrolase/energy-coupling factor transporter ATP-binding protein EcfA2